MITALLTVYLVVTLPTARSRGFSFHRER
jgi:hypothetical protein